MRRLIAFCIFAPLFIRFAPAQSSDSERADWNRRVKPFRIAGNIYSVGVAGISIFLIHTDEGSILIDGGLPETAPIIEGNIASLGFRLNDVKILLNSHAHFDHAGGLAELKRRSGAKMIASRADAEVLTSGRQISFGTAGDSLFPAVAVDRMIADGETVTLGGVTMTAHLTPGHTKGCTTWTTQTTEAGKTYNVVFYCSTSAPGYKLVNNAKYPNIVSDYEHSFNLLSKLPCDIFLGPHPEFFEMNEKLKRLAAGGSNPFIDPNEMQAYVAESKKAFELELKRQQR